MELGNSQTVALAGFGLAVVFGFIANKTNFCTMGAVSDWVNMGDKGRLRAWFLAIGIAIIGTQIMQGLGYIDLSKSIYLTANFGWLGAVIGGLSFGVGMTLGSGCGQRTLVRMGGGNLKSLVVFLVLAVTAYMTLRGLIAVFRIGYIETSNVDLSTHGLADQGIVTALMTWTGMHNVVLMRALVAGVVSVAMLFFAFKDAEFRKSFDNILAGVGIGLLIIAGWYVTGVLGKDDFDPVALESFSFVSPVGNTLQYLMTYTGSTINFGIAAVFGMITGSFIYAVITRKFRIETFSSRSDMVNHLIGGMLMGFGGILSLGCTIGQGVTGMSTLAMGSVITLAGIIFGSAVTMKIQYYMLDEQGFFGAFRSTLADFGLFPAKKTGAA